MKQGTILLCFFLLLKMVLHLFLISPEYELHRDEFLHLDQAKHLAWGYLSVPPVTSWVSFIIWKLGNGLFWVKFFPALFGALTILVVWRTVETLKGGLFACSLGAMAVLFSVVMRLNILYQPNSLDVLCWTLLYFTIIKYVATAGNKWLYAAAVVFAVGFLNKYNIAFLLAGLLPAILLSSHRKIFLNKHLYFAIILGIILISPNLYWQYSNGFPVVYHMSLLAKTQLVNNSAADFVKEQFIFFIGSLFIIVASFVAFFRYHSFKQYQFVLWSFVFTMLIFIYFKAKGYYAIGLYPVLIAHGAVYLERIITGRFKVAIATICLLLPFILFIPMVFIAFPVSPPVQAGKTAQYFKALNLLRWEDGKDHALPQDFADMQGWRELAQKVDTAYGYVQGDGYTLVLTDNYGQAGAINYYTRNKNIQAVSMNADYINWFPLDKKINNVILVENHDEEKSRERTLFKRVEKFGEITNPYAREVGSAIYILAGAKADINEVLRKEVEEERSLW